METVEIAGGILWYTARKHRTRRGNASGRTSEEVQQKLLPGLGYFDASRASFGSPVPPIGACRGAKPPCVLSIPQ